MRPGPTAIHAARRRAGLTQAGLATACGLSPAMIGHLESGRRRVGQLGLLAACKLAMALGVGVADLMETQFKAANAARERR